MNDLMDQNTMRHLLRYDSVHGRFAPAVELRGASMVIEGRQILCYHESDPQRLPWRGLGVDVVIESTGVFLHRSEAEIHLQAGAGKVIISAPARDEDVKFIVLGVNDHLISPDDHILSNASCTTNCAAPMIKVLDDNWGIERVFVTTVHSYTMDQNLHDGPHHKDLRRARAAAESIIPTSTGAAKALRNIFPHLGNNLGGAGIRVPVPDGSLTDITCTLSRSTSISAINEAFRAAASGTLRGILEYTEDPIVSVDVIGNPHSVVFDAGMTAVLGEANKLIKVVGWYDNESGYATRLRDLVLRIG